MECKCYTCLGTGTIPNPNYCREWDSNFHLDTRTEITCPDCKGEGIIWKYDEYWDNYRD